LWLENESATEALLFTNSDEVKDVVSERTGFFCIRGADLALPASRRFALTVPWAKFDDGLPRQEGFLPEDRDFDDPSLHQ
jgi:hypothetical protein